MRSLAPFLLASSSGMSAAFLGVRMGRNRVSSVLLSSRALWPNTVTRAAFASINDRTCEGPKMALSVPPTPKLTYTAAPTVSITAADVKGWSGDMLVVPVFQPEDKEALAEVPSGLGDAFSAAAALIVAAEEVKGAAKSSTSCMVATGDASMTRLALVGVGKKEAMDGNALAAFGAQLASLAKSAKAKSVGVLLPEGTDANGARAAFEAMLIGLYSDNRYKTGDRVEKPAKLETVTVLLGGAADSSSIDVSAAVSAARASASGVYLCRDLVNSPANYLTPAKLAEAAEKVAQEHGLDCEILEEKKIKELGMGAYWGVAQGACEPPKFIHLTYKPKGGASKKLALIGKGLTFDSGGYNIKAGAGSMIEMMKFDMGGAGATIGAAKVIGQMQPPDVEVHFIVAACENMVSAEAMRPGDILVASNGKTIEVGNTDAEGRLTLADALVFAEKLGVDAIVDSATLTGACIVALGDGVAGVWTPDDALAAELNAASTSTGEKIWRMPLVAEYAESIKSKVADLKNVGGRAGGSITAALFLKEFVEKTPWAHVDIAGPVWDGKSGSATGYGVRLLSRWVLSRAEGKADNP